MESGKKKLRMDIILYEEEYRPALEKIRECWKDTLKSYIYGGEKNKAPVNPLIYNEEKEENPSNKNNKKQPKKKRNTKNSNEKPKKKGKKGKSE